MASSGRRWKFNTYILHNICKDHILEEAYDRLCWVWVVAGAL